MYKTLPEFIKIGVYDASSVYTNKQVTPKRKVSLFEIEFIIEDGGTSYIDGVDYAIKKNAIIFTKPGQERYTRLPYKCLYLHIVVKDPELAMLFYKIPTLFMPQNPEKYREIFTSIVAKATAEIVDELSIYADFFKLMEMVSNEVKYFDLKENKNRSHAETIKNAILFMNQNYSRSISLADVANHVNVSRTYFHKLFLSSTGITVHTYLLNKRMETAKKLLITSDLSYSQIASACGFASQSHFNYTFKKKTGESPGSFVKKTYTIYGK